MFLAREQTVGIRSSFGVAVWCLLFYHEFSPCATA